MHIPGQYKSRKGDTNLFHELAVAVVGGGRNVERLHHAHREDEGHQAGGRGAN